MEKSEAMKQLIEIVDITVQACMGDMSTKDGYATMLCVLDKVPEASKKNFVLLCIKRGYPMETGVEVLKICGIEE